MEGYLASIATRRHSITETIIIVLCKLIYLFLLNSLKSKLLLSSKIDVQTERFISFIFRGARNSKVLASRTVLWCDIQTGGSDPPAHISINYIKSHIVFLQSASFDAFIYVIR